MASSASLSCCLSGRSVEWLRSSWRSGRGVTGHYSGVLASALTPTQNGLCAQSEALCTKPCLWPSSGRAAQLQQTDGKASPGPHCVGVRGSESFGYQEGPYVSTKQGAGLRGAESPHRAAQKHRPSPQSVRPGLPIPTFTLAAGKLRDWATRWSTGSLLLLV